MRRRGGGDWKRPHNLEHIGVNASTMLSISVSTEIRLIYFWQHLYHQYWRESLILCKNSRLLRLELFLSEDALGV